MSNTDRHIRTFLESIIEECDLLAKFVRMIPEDRYLGGSLEHTMLLRAIAVSEQRIGEAAAQVMNLSIRPLVLQILSDLDKRHYAP